MLCFRSLFSVLVWGALQDELIACRNLCCFGKESETILPCLQERFLPLLNPPPPETQNVKF